MSVSIKTNLGPESCQSESSELWLMVRIMFMAKIVIGKFGVRLKVRISVRDRLVRVRLE